MWEKLGGVVSRLRFVVGRGRMSREASDELRFHRELLIARFFEIGVWSVRPDRALEPDGPFAEGRHQILYSLSP